MKKLKKEQALPVVKTLEISEELKAIGDLVITKENLDIGNATIKYLFSTPYISKSVAGKCIKASKEMQYLGECDYIIEMSFELWNQLTEQDQYLLMLHELMHILAVINDKTGNWKYKIKDHDIKDFSLIVNKYGTDWTKKVKLANSSLYDLSPAEEDGFKI